MARIKPLALQEPLKAVTVKLTPAAGQTLQRLSQEVTDALGWTVTTSAVMRALVHYAERQPPEWATTTLLPLIEEEISQGRVWGSKKRRTH